MWEFHERHRWSIDFENSMTESWWNFLPLKPMWPGLAVNTVFFAIVIWLLIRVPTALQRFIRVRRGLCPACAYPRGKADRCSECGIRH